MHRRLVVAVLIGCGAFVALTLLGAVRIYQAFSASGIPVWSGGKIVATLDTFTTLAVVVAVFVSSAALVSWRTLRFFQQESRDAREL